MKTQQEMQSLLHGMKMRIDLEQVLPAPAGWLVVNLQRNAWAPLYATGVCSVTYHDEEGENEPVREVLPLVWTGVQIALFARKIRIGGGIVGIVTNLAETSFCTGPKL